MTSPLNIPNPLDAFESYSCHYVLVVCRSSSVAVNFASTNPDTQRNTLAAIEAAKKLGDPVIVDKQNPNDAFLVLDTRRFSQFTVDSARYDVTINGLQRGADLSNVASNFSMVVHDSVGMSFANYLQWIMDSQLKTSFDGMVFMFRVIFTGHKPDGTTEMIQSETVPLILSKTEIDLEFSKGVYNMEFMPLMNYDVNQNRRFLTVSLATTYKTGAGNKLGPLVQSLEDELNRKSTEFYKGVQAIYAASGRSSTIGRPVEYLITIPKSWENFEVLGGSTGKASETKFFVQAVGDAEAKKTADQKATVTAAAQGARGSRSKEVAAAEAANAKINDTYTASQPGALITDVLKDMFAQVPEIAKLGNFKTDPNDQDPNGYVTFFNQLVGVTSDNHKMTVHVDVVEFKVSKLDVQAKTVAQQKIEVAERDNELYTTTHFPNGTYQKFPKDCIEYDYIFTGLNKDIMSLEIKIQDFVQLLQSDLHIGDTALQTAADAAGDPPLAVQKEMDALIYTRQFDPIIMPMDSFGALKNFSNYATFLKTAVEANQIRKDAQQYAKNLSQYYAGSPITLQMTIKGNPLIMHKFNHDTILPHASPDSTSTNAPPPAGGGAGLNKIQYREYIEEKILGIKNSKGSFKQDTDGSFVLQSALTSKSYMVSPVYVKVNIKGPNVDFKTNAPAPLTENYTSSILSDSVYTVMTVVNNFQGGVFTQELTLMAMNLFGRDSINKANGNSLNAATAGTH